MKKFINYLLCFIAIFSFMITPVMAKEDDLIYLDWSADNYDADSFFDVLMSDNLFYKDGYVTIKSHLDDGVDLSYYNENGKILNNNHFDGLYFLDGIVVDDYIYLLLTDDLGYNSDFESSMYLYKIDKTMHEVEHILVTNNTGFIPFMVYLCADFLGYDFINYVDNEICLVSFSLIPEFGPEFDLLKYKSNLDYSGKIDILSYIDGESDPTRFFSLTKEYFPSIELLLRSIINELQKINDEISSRNEINKLNSAVYISNLVTKKIIVSSGVRLDGRNLSGDYSYVDEDGNEEFDYDKYYDDINNNFRAVASLKIMDTNENIIVEKEVPDYTFIVSPKISNNYIIATGYKIPFPIVNVVSLPHHEMEQPEINADILVFDLNGNLVETINSDGEMFTSVQETSNGFVTLGFSINDSNSCGVNVPSEPHVSSREMLSYFNVDEAAVPKVFGDYDVIQNATEFDLPGMIFKDAQNEPAEVSTCATCRTKVYNFDPKFRINNPSTFSNGFVLLVLSSVLLSILCILVILKKKPINDK